jgi:hypothetical protein
MQRAEGMNGIISTHIQYYSISSVYMGTINAVYKYELMVHITVPMDILNLHGSDQFPARTELTPLMQIHIDMQSYCHSTRIMNDTMLTCIIDT